MTSCGTIMFDHMGDGSIACANQCICLKYILFLRNHGINAKLIKKKFNDRRGPPDDLLWYHHV